MSKCSSIPETLALTISEKNYALRGLRPPWGISPERASIPRLSAYEALAIGNSILPG